MSKFKKLEGNIFLSIFKPNQINSNTESHLADKIIELFNKNKEKEDSQILELNNLEIDILNNALLKIEPYPIKLYVEKDNSKTKLSLYPNSNSPLYRKTKIIPKTVFSWRKVFNEFYNWITGKFSMLTLVLGLLFFTARKQTFEKIILLLNESIFIPIKGTPFLTWSFILSFIFLFLYWTKKYLVKERISKWNNFFNLGVILPYLYFRFFNSTFDFFPISIQLPFYYVDLLLIHFIGLLIFNITYTWEKRDIILKGFEKHWNTYWITKNKELIESTPLFFEDTPIENIEEDRFNRSRFAKELAQRIVIKNTESSFAISIQDEWGNGKTSFLNMLAKECQGYPDIITIRFNPWLAENKKLLISDFFEVLHEKTGVYDAKLSRQIQLYAQKLSNITKSTYLRLLETILSLNNNSNLYKHYGQINNRIKKLGKKIIIFIDDIDRLDNDEVIEVLRIIRNTSNFNNTFFVVANDRKYIENSLDKNNVYKPEKFPDKIFQMEFSLPFVRTEVLLNELSNLLIKFFKDKQEEIENLIEKSELNWSYYFKNSRDIKRFLNAFNQYYPFIKEEVNFSDYFFNTLLRIYFHHIYKELAKNKNQYLFTSNISNQISLKFLLEDNGENKQAQIIKFLDQMESDSKINKESKEQIVKLLELIFNDQLESSKNEIFNPYEDLYEGENLNPNIIKSIRNPSNSQLYFSDHFLTEIITNSEFYSFLKLEETKLLNCIDQLIKEEKFKNQLEEKFLYYYVTPKDPLFKNWYLGYVYFLKHTHQFGHSGILNQLLTFDEKGKIHHHSVPRSKLNPTFNFQGISDEEKKQYFKKIFKGKYAFSPKNDSDLLHGIRRDFYYNNHNTDSIFIKEAELLDMNITLLRDYIYNIDKKGISLNKDLIFTFFFNCQSEIKKEEDKFRIMAHEANKMLVELAKKKSDEFLNYLIYNSSPFEGEESFFIIESIIMAFGSIKGFELFLNEIPNKNHIVVQFYNTYKAKSFKPIPLDNADPLKKRIMDLIELREKD